MQRLYTNHQVACAQEQHHTEDVDHAGGKNAVPGAEEHGLPHKQVDPPPWLAGLLEALVREARNATLDIRLILAESRVVTWGPNHSIQRYCWFTNQHFNII